MQYLNTYSYFYQPLLWLCEFFQYPPKDNRYNRPVILSDRQLWKSSKPLCPTNSYVSAIRSIETVYCGPDNCLFIHTKNSVKRQKQLCYLHTYTNVIFIANRYKMLCWTNSAFVQKLVKWRCRIMQHRFVLWGHRKPRSPVTKSHYKSLEVWLDLRFDRKLLKKPLLRYIAFYH